MPLNKMAKFKKIAKVFVATSALALVFTFYAAYGEQLDSQRWRVYNSQSETITGPDGVCQKITNNGSRPILVPIKTVSEWQTFLNHLPPLVSKGPCAYCGDGSCNNGESCSSCPGDCGSCCGNGACDNGESCSSCPGDCGACPPAYTWQIDTPQGYPTESPHYAGCACFYPPYSGMCSDLYNYSVAAMEVMYLQPCSTPASCTACGAWCWDYSCR